MPGSLEVADRGRDGRVRKFLFGCILRQHVYFGAVIVQGTYDVGVGTLCRRALGHPVLRTGLGHPG